MSATPAGTRCPDGVEATSSVPAVDLWFPVLSRDHPAIHSAGDIADADEIELFEAVRKKAGN